MSEKLLDLLSDAASELRVRAEGDRMCGLTGKGCDRLADELLDAVEALERPFKRGSDPKGCGYRSGGDCASIGVSMHCKLEAGHQPLGHDYEADPRPTATHGLCVYGWEGPDVVPGCGEPLSAHGRPHAMEVSDRYVLEQLEKAGRG